MRLAQLIVVIAALAGSVGANSAFAGELCQSAVASSVGPLRDIAAETNTPSKAAKSCRSPVKVAGRLPTCTQGPSITCHGTCSGGAEWFSWQCCIGPDGFPPACSLNCTKEFAGCLAQ